MDDENNSGISNDVAPSTEAEPARWLVVDDPADAALQWRPQSSGFISATWADRVREMLGCGYYQLATHVPAKPLGDAPAIPQVQEQFVGTVAEVECFMEAHYDG